MWTEPAMDRVTLFVIELLSLLVVASAGNGNFSTQNGSSNAIAEATGQNQGTRTFICSVHDHFVHVSKRVLSLKELQYSQPFPAANKVMA